MADVCNECLGGNVGGGGGGGCIEWWIWPRSGPGGIDDDEWGIGGTPVKWLFVVLERNSDDLFGDDLW